MTRVPIGRALQEDVVKCQVAQMPLGERLAQVAVRRNPKAFRQSLKIFEARS